MNLTMMFTPEVTKGLEITETIQQQLKEVGVTVKIEQVDSATFMERRPTANWDLASSGSTGWTGDADFYINTVVAQINYANPAMTDARQKASDATDPTVRAQYLKAAQKVIWDDVPYIWSFQTMLFNGLSNKLKGVQVMPASWMYFWGAELTA
jgi:peptide/nickel transport system substrate-binding protein